MKLIAFVLCHVFVFTKTQESTRPATLQATITNDIATTRSVFTLNDWKAWVDDHYLGRFADRLNAYRGELYAALNEQVLAQELIKRQSLRNLLNGNPDALCGQIHEEAMNIATQTSRVTFEMCEAVVKSNAQLLRDQLNIRRAMTATEVRNGEFRLEVCRNIYALNYDINEYNDCVATAKTLITEAYAFSYNRSVKGEEVQNVFLGLARCADKYLNAFQTVMNELYAEVTKCLSSSNNPQAKGVIAVVNTYTLNITVDLEGQVRKALSALKVNSEPLFRAAAYEFRARFQTLRERRDRGQSEIADFLKLGNDFKAYETMYRRQQENTTLYTSARNCFNQVYAKNQENVNTRANTVRNCIRAYNLNPSEGDVNKLIYDLKNRDINEGVVAVVNCLGDRRNTLRRNLTGLCSEAADKSYSLVVAEVEIQLKTYNGLYDQLTKDFDACEQSVVLEILSQLMAERRNFELCVQNIYPNYKLPASAQ